MKLIDTNTGDEILEGRSWENVNGRKLCNLIRPGLLSVEVAYTRMDTGEIHTLVLPIRLTHPQFFLQRVAFFPS